MESKEKIDNELIAEFMGGVRFGNCGSIGIVWRFENGDYADQDDLNYSESWDWLMPACLKWDSIDMGQFNATQRKQYQSLCDDLDSVVSCYEINPTYRQMCKNINWLNQQSK